MGPVVSEKKIFEFLSHSKSMETIDPRAVAKGLGAGTIEIGPVNAGKIKINYD